MWFFVGAIALVVISIVARQLLPPPKPNIVGIDLGTTYSCIAAYQVGTGVVDVIPTASGHTTVPSVVFFGEDMHVTVGRDAKHSRTLAPASTIYEAKRFIGRNSKLTQDELNRFPFALHQDDKGNIRFDVPHWGLVSPEDVGGHVVKTLRLQAEKHFNKPIRMAVMSVPAEFSEKQRNATIRAAANGGIEVLRLLSEPTAAAMAYGLHTAEDVEFILVFDFGGGTLDVSLLSLEAGVFTTLAIAGDKRLGGEDFSHLLYLRLLPELEASFKDMGCEVEPVHNQLLRTAADDAKLALSQHMSANVIVPCDASYDTATTQQEPTLAFNYTLTRQSFEDIAQPLFDRTLRPVDTALSAADLQRRDIDRVVLVGGSTRMPKVRNLLEDAFGKPPNFEINPDEAVARGVAMQAGILAGGWPLQVAAIEIPFSSQKIEMDVDDDDM
eukprot:m.225077 g.225077  ORF g.225077 m.225077 type:complete len:440 (-) comp15157_c2_seq6:1906-3225(-)